MKYREIITYHLKEAIRKRDKTKDEKEINYWDYIKGELISDLRDYEKRGRWNREPYDKAWQKYKPVRHLTPEEIIRRFFEDDFFGF